MTSLLTPPQPTVPRHLGLLGRIGRSSARHPRRVIVSWAIVVLAAAPLAITMGSALSGAGWDAQGSTAAEVRAELRKDFPQLGAEAAIVAYRQPAPIADDPSGLILLVASLEGSPGTASVIDPLAQPPVRGLISPDGRAALVPVVLSAPQDAELPESAGSLMATVASVDLLRPTRLGSGRCGTTSTRPTSRRYTRQNCCRGCRR